MGRVIAFVQTNVFWVFLTIVALGPNTRGLGAETKQNDNWVERWNVFELVVDGHKDDNAYIDVNFAATFETKGKKITVPGFYDGDGKYKVRFSPAKLGRWTYATQSNRNELADKTGSLNCIKPSAGNHGPLQVVSSYYFQYADGSPYYAVGTTAYQWTSVDQKIQQDTLDTLATAPFNKIRMCFFPKWYPHGNETEPWAYPFKRDGDQNDYTRPNYEFFRNFDRRVLQLRDMGIQADVILFHSYDKWGYEKMGRENDDRYLRYLIARLSAYRNVWWSVANEYDLMIMKEEKTLGDFDRYFQILQKEDPHQRLRGNHNYAGTDDHFYDHAQSWVTHASTQTSQFFNALKWRNQYKKPLLFDEMRYEGGIKSHWGRLTGEEMSSYFWMAGLSGGYGTHGDTFDNRAGGTEARWWGKGGTLVGTSPTRIAFFRKIMEQAPVVEMTPTLVSTGKPETLADNIHIFAKAGEYYLAYVASTGKEIRLDLPPGAVYKVELIDTWNMTIKKLPDAKSGEFSYKTTNAYTALRVIKKE